MDNLFQNKWFVAVISFIFAVALFLYVDLESNPAKKDASILPSVSQEIQTLEDVPLEVRMDTDQYVVSGVPDYITVSFEGKSTVLNRYLKQSNYNFFVDLTEYEEGEHSIEIEYENIPEDLTVYLEPKSIDVSIEKRAAKEFDIEVDYVNLDQLPVGYELGEPEITPGKVTIVSSEEVLERVAMVKVYVDVADLRESIRNREVPISVSDIQGNVLNVGLDPTSVMISIPVDRPSKKVPVSIRTVGELPDGYQLKSITTINEIDIFGKRDIINEIEEVVTKEIDLSRMNQSEEIDIELDLPDNIAVNNEIVSVSIQLEQERIFERIPIETNETNDQQVTFVDPANGFIDIVANGDEAIIKALNKDDIIAKIDVSNLTEGEHDIDVTLEGPSNVRLTTQKTRIKIDVQIE